MKLPRNLNGVDFVKKIEKLEFEQVRQSGSHVMMRHLPSGAVISVPAHRPIKPGTLNQLLRLISRITDTPKDELIAMIVE